MVFLQGQEFLHMPPLGSAPRRVHGLLPARSVALPLVAALHRPRAQKKPLAPMTRSEGHTLATCQAPYHFCGALLIQTDTDERDAIVHRPVAPVLPDGHTLSPLEEGQACGLCPYGLP